MLDALLFFFILIHALIWKGRRRGSIHFLARHPYSRLVAFGSVGDTLIRSPGQQRATSTLTIPAGYSIKAFQRRRIRVTQSHLSTCQTWASNAKHLTLSHLPLPLECSHQITTNPRPFTISSLRTTIPTLSQPSSPASNHALPRQQ